MERKIDLHIEKLPEGFYLATSKTIQGLVAQGRTISETLEIARCSQKTFGSSVRGFSFRSPGIWR